MRQRLQSGDTVMRITLNDGLRAIGRLFVPAKGTGPLADETPKRTGKLARSTYFTIQGAPEDQELDILQPAQTGEGDFYGLYVREGTAPHVIVPKRARALRFEIGGKVLFRKLVHHPGTKANPYHRRVLARLRPEVQNLVNKMGAKVVAYLSGKGV
ncbi:MAG: hypothetical protein Q8M94_12180 [Ignavibacteria bacterium]|nr:hypothetical protein [Ignavibacteria bacterium]